MITLENAERVLTHISECDSSGETSLLEIASPGNFRRIRRVQVFTIAWMLVEAAVSLLSAWRARSPALLAFGGDSAVELVSAGGCALEISHHCRTRACRKTGGANHRFFAVCAGCLCDGRFRLEFAGLQRTRTNRHGDRHPVVGCHRYAVACEGETEAINCDLQRRTESGRRRIRHVCLPCGDCFGGSGD
jgi:hypothetical protein